MKKRILSWLTAFLITSALAVPAFSGSTASAAIGSTDKADLTIKSLQKDDEVTLYKIGTAVYNSDGSIFYKFKYLEGVSLTETEPTQEEIVDIATNILNDTVKVPATDITTYTWAGDAEDATYSYTTMDVQGSTTGETTVDFKVQREAGVYIAIVDPASAEYVYNPLLLAVSYYFDEENNCAKLSEDEQRTVDIKDKYLYGVDAVEKSTHVTLDKTTAGGETDNDGTKDIVTGSVGTVLDYTISPVLPIYPQTASNKTFYVTDRMTEGLTFAYRSLLVTLKNTETIRWGVTSEDDITGTANTATGTYSIAADGDTFKTSYAKWVPEVPATYEADGTTVKTPAEDAHWEIVPDVTIATAKEAENGFNLSFVYDNLLYTTPVITYQAVINDDAVVGNAGNPNTAKLIFANDPTTGSTYTDITSPPDPSQTALAVTEVEDKVTIYTYELKFKKVDTKKDSAGNTIPLANAIFGVYSDAACENLVDIVKTNSEGLGYSNQISKGSYYLKEITPPDGYSLNETVYGPYAVDYSTATTKTTKATTTVEYTSDETQAMEGTGQVGWLVDNKFFAEEPANVTYVTYTASGTPIGYLAADGTFSAEAGEGLTAVYAATADAYDQILWQVMNGYYVAQPAYIKTMGQTAASTTQDTVEGAGSGVKDIGVDIPNTRLSALPSTGGAGTYILTVSGVAVFGVAVYLMFRGNKRKDQAEE